MPLFSVIIPVFNRLDLLRRAVDSIKLQRFADYEVIVVDDGSNDGTWEWLREQASFIRSFRQQNGGPGRARNLAASHARGDYLAFLDSDDCWFPWTLEVYARTIRQANRPSFIAGKPWIFSESDELESTAEDRLAYQVFPDYYSSGDEWRWFGVSSFVIRRSVFSEVGGFSDNRINGEDADLALRLGTAAGFAHITSPATFGYHRHEANLTKSTSLNLSGILEKIRNEREGRFPGGVGRKAERLRILTRHLRPIACECAERGMGRDGLHLYLASFRWHLAIGRWKFLIGFPAKLVKECAGRIRSGKRHA